MAIDFRKMFSKARPADKSEPPSAGPDQVIVNEPDDSINILIWGPTGCGKSAFVCGWFCSDKKRWRIKENDETTRQFREDGTKLLSNGRFIPQTNPGLITHLRFTFERVGIFATERLKLLIPECAGERFAAMDAELLNSIDEYDGILWLIDPIRAWREQGLSLSELDELKVKDPYYATYREMLHRWLNAFYRARSSRRRGKRRMAFCLTKMDHPHHIPWIQQPQLHFNQLLGPDTVNLIDDYCDPKDIKYFACSVAGVDGNNESNAMQRASTIGNQITMTVGERLNGRPKPFGLFEPLEWLFGR